MADPTPNPSPSPSPDPTPTPDPAPQPDPTPDPTPDPDPGKGGKDALLADLAKERDKRQGLETRLSEMETAQQTQLDAIAKALGLKPDDQPDPTKLAEQVAAEQAKATEAARQLAVFQAAGPAGANAARLLDSASFLRSIATVDPTDSTALAAAIKTAVDADDTFKAAAPTPGFGGGPQPTPTPGGTGVLGAALTDRLLKQSR